MMEVRDGRHYRALAKQARMVSDYVSVEEFGGLAMLADRESGDSAGMSEDRSLLAGTYILTDRSELAEQMALQVISDEGGTSAAFICANCILGLVHLRRTDYSIAEKVLEAALAEAIEGNRMDLSGAIYANLARVKSLKGNPSSAIELLAVAIDIFERLRMLSELERAKQLYLGLQSCGIGNRNALDATVGGDL
jgi:hypothetical protein